MRIIKDELKIKRHLPILAQEKYLKIKSDNYGWFEDENYILPYFIDKRLIFKRMVFTYGLIAKKDNLTIDEEKKFLNNIVEYVKEHKMCDFIYKAQSNVIFNACPNRSDCVEWGTYYVDLSLSEDELLKSFHSNHRRAIKKAIKEDVVVEETSDTNIVFDIISQTLIRQKSIHYPSLEYIKHIKAISNKEMRFFISKKDGVVQGAIILSLNEKKALYLYGGSIIKPVRGSINLLHFNAMKTLKKEGILVYDFVGARINVEKNSKYEGIQTFKSRFGASLQKGYAFRYIVNPFKFKLFNIVSKSYLKLKGYNYIDPIDSIKSVEE